MRAGAQALSLLSVPLNVQVLQALEVEPTSLIDLRGAAGSPPQTTMRCGLRTLTELGLLERRQQPAFAGSAEFLLTDSGRALLEIGETVARWLKASPQGPMDLGGLPAKSALKALTEGWSTAIVRALSAKPLALTELSQLISDLSYPALERRLTAMRLAGQIEPCPGGGRGTPYRVTDWLRLALGPLVAAAAWEREHLPDRSAPIGRIDVEAAFLLTIPRMRLPENLTGSCRLAVELRSAGGEIRFAGVLIEVEGGRVASCVSRLKGQAGAAVSGSIAAWLYAATRGETDRLEIAGDRRLAEKVLDGAYRAASGDPSRSLATPLGAVSSP